MYQPLPLPLPPSPPPEVDNALGKVQTVLEGLMAGLESRGLSDCVNIIFTSDHGRLL